MKTLDLKTFRDLKESEELLCLDWFGAISPNPDEPDNPLLECYFTPITIKTGSTWDYFSRSYSSQVCIGISVGYLPALYIGQVYKNGIHDPSIECGNTDIIEFEFDSSNNKSTNETTISKANLSEKSKLINARFENTRNKAGAKFLVGHISKAKQAKTQNDSLKRYSSEATLLIHEIELIRFYFTNSSFLTKNIFSDSFHPENILSRIINIKQEVLSFDAETKSARFVYRIGFSKNDIPILGRILFEPDARGLKAVNRILNSILAGRVNTCLHKGYPRTNFPFSGKTTLKLIGRKISTSETNEPYFLVHRILACSANFPFKNLSYCCEACPGGKAAPENAPAAFPGSNTIYKGPANETNRLGDSVSDEQPLTGSEKITTQLPSREFGGLQDVNLVHEKLRDCTHTSKQKSHKYLEYLLNASTGGSRNKKSSTVRQDLDSPPEPPPKASIDLALFIRVINTIKNSNKIWICKTIQFEGGFTSNGENYSYFPEVACDVKDINRQFAYADNEKKVRRQFICVEFNIGNKFMYLFEAQRRPKQNGKETLDYKERMPVLLVRKNDFQQLISKDFTELLESTVKKRTWDIPNSKRTVLILDRSSHNLSNEAEGDMKRIITDLIQRNTN
ncbi:MULTISPECIES: hypothetical protein [Methylomonas]|uniref:TnsE C-terminal domain-containing protein n=2 Tax=Methylomonas TaxID=416 RepID=A0A126T384_9GAMM|nr:MULTISPECIES: hypothetical protein [Methylomonas]AMK76522.1 hypothetical protein JT25_008455 [Methylomonas denitrificans]OAH98779.1 hypothetical protein A1342_13195 [Methylomonas methanica]